MTIRYINHAGVEIDLTKAPYMALGGNLQDFNWSLNTVTRASGIGGRVNSFANGVVEKELPIQIWAHSRAEYAEAINALHDLFAADVFARQSGRLYVGDSYVLGYGKGMYKTEWDDGADYMVCTVIFAIESGYWCSETTQEFNLFQTAGADSFKFPGRFPCKFCASGGVATLINANSYAMPARIVAYGPAVNPSFLINAAQYIVYTELIEGERVVIDQLAGTVYKVTTSGEIINEFNNRGKNPSVFEPIPAGESIVYYSGNFPFEITILAQRSEPLWE